jgi:hypothetical protein
MKCFQLFGLLSVFLLSSTAFSQQAKFPKCTARLPGTAIYKNWQEIWVGWLKICLPKEFGARQSSCYEGKCYEYESNESNILIDLDDMAWLPTQAQKLNSTYSEKFVSIDGHSAWMWRYESGGTYTYVFGVNFKSKSTNNFGPGIYFHSKSASSIETAQLIFDSIKLRR